MEDPKNTKDDKKEKETSELEEEVTDDELKNVRGGDGVVTDVPGNTLGSLEELSDEELSGLSGGVNPFHVTKKEEGGGVTASSHALHRTTTEQGVAGFFSKE